MDTNWNTNDFDAIVIGGSYAGLSAAMQLARTRRRVLVIDAGLRRNRFAQKSHGFLGQDGRDGATIASEGRAQVLAYPNVRWLEGLATHASRDEDGFVVTVGTGEVVHGRRLVLATGVVDELPAIDGLALRWGKSVFACPYCDGYELDNGRIGVLATSPMSFHHAMLLPDWGQVTLFTNEAFVPDASQVAELGGRGVVIEPEPVLRIVDTATVELEDGRLVPMDGLFTLGRIRMSSPLAEQLGCAFDEGPFGAIIRTDPTKETTVPGVFASGDAARMMASVALSVADGAVAGMAAHRSLIFQPLPNVAIVADNR